MAKCRIWPHHQPLAGALAHALLAWLGVLVLQPPHDPPSPPALSPPLPTPPLPQSIRRQLGSALGYPSVLASGKVTHLQRQLTSARRTLGEGDRRGEVALKQMAVKDYHLGHQLDRWAFSGGGGWGRRRGGAGGGLRTGWGWRGGVG